MSGILDTVQQQLTPDTINQISQKLGIDPATAQQAVNSALPVVLGGMASHAASDPSAAASITDQAENHAGLLGGLGNLISGGGSGGGLLGGIASAGGGGSLGGMLGSIMGGNHAAVQDGVSQASGLDSQRSKQLMMILAPIVLAAIVHHKRTSGLDASQVPGELQQSAQQAHEQAVQQAPHMGGLLGGIMSHVMQQPK
jgi:hypothetical protein